MSGTYSTYRSLAYLSFVSTRFPVWDVPAMPSSSRLSNIPIWVDDLVLSHSSAGRHLCCFHVLALIILLL